MARFLITTIPMKGHIYPMMPIVKRLIKMNHRVRWVVEENYLEDAKPSKAECYKIENKFTHQPEDFNILNIFKNYHPIKTQMKWVFVDYPLSQEETIRKAIKEFNPSVIFTDCIYIISLLIAKQLNIPCAVLGVIPYPAKSKNTAPFGMGLQPTKNVISHRRNNFLHFVSKNLFFSDFFEYAERRASHFKKFFNNKTFFDVFIDHCDLYLQASIEQLEYSRDNLNSKFHFIGPPTYKPPGKGGLTEELQKDIDNKDPKIPLLFVTQGTVDNYKPNLLLSCFKALKKKNMIVVMIVPENIKSIFYKAPKNFHIVEKLRYHEIMPYTDIFITNGGFGGVQIALSHGVPLIVAGRSDDKGEVAARIAWSKCGINLKKSSPSPRSIRRAVNKILLNNIYRTKAQEMKNNIDNTDTPEKACKLLEKLI